MPLITQASIVRVREDTATLPLLFDDPRAAIVTYLCIAVGQQRRQAVSQQHILE